MYYTKYLVGTEERKNNFSQETFWKTSALKTEKTGGKIKFVFGDKLWL